MPGLARTKKRDDVRNDFLGWDGPALPLAAARLADEYTDGAALRLDRCLLVLPGGRAGRRLKELLVDVAAERGLRLVPPDVVTIAALSERLYEPARPLASGTLARRVLADTLRAVPASELATLFPTLPARDDVRGWLTLAREIERVQRAVGAGGLTCADVVAHVERGLLFDDSARWTLLARVQSTYAAALARLGYADADLARIAAVTHDAITCDRDVWLIGVAELPGIVRRMLHGARLRVRALVHAPAALADAFDELGCVVPAHWARTVVPLDDTAIAVVGRPVDQADEVLRTIAALDGRRSADEIVIGVPDEEVVPYVTERLEAAGVPARYAAGRRIEETRPYRLLAAVADYLDGGASTAFAALVRHPDVRGADASLEALDEYLREALPSRVDRALPGQGGRRETVHALRRRIELLLGAALRARDARRPLGEWAPLLLELLARVYVDSVTNRHEPRQRALLDACDALRDAAAELHRVPAAIDEPCDASTALRLLLDEVAGQRIAPEPERAAVELLGWLELHLDDAPVAIVTGANEPHVPESVNADAFLPNALRARLGLEDNERRYARDAYQLSALAMSRPLLRVVAGRRTAMGDPLRPSRLLLALRGAALAARVRRFLGDDARVRPPLFTPPHAARSGFVLPPEPLLHAAQPIETISVTAFARLIRDPYLYALESILRLRAVDDAARELDPLGFGSLAHEVLDRFGRSSDAHATDEAVVRAALDALLDDETRQRFGTGGAYPAVRIQIEQLRSRLHAFAGWHAAWIGDGWRVIGVERETQPGGVPVVLAGESIRLTGRVDRIDFHAGRGEYALLDYKTGENGLSPDRTHLAGRRENRVWIDLQLPLYRHIAYALHDDAGVPIVPRGAALRLGYVLLCRDRERIGLAEADWSAAELAAADARAADVIRLLRANVFEFTGARPVMDPAFAALLGQLRLAGVADEPAALTEALS
jgi:ATP-dependent helicase/nuclease subunit B